MHDNEIQAPEKKMEDEASDSRLSIIIIQRFLFISVSLLKKKFWMCFQKTPNHDDMQFYVWNINFIQSHRFQRCLARNDHELTKHSS